MPCLLGLGLAHLLLQHSNEIHLTVPDKFPVRMNADIPYVYNKGLFFCFLLHWTSILFSLKTNQNAGCVFSTGPLQMTRTDLPSFKTYLLCYTKSIAMCLIYLRLPCHRGKNSYHTKKPKNCARSLDGLQEKWIQRRRDFHLSHE